MGRDGSTLVPNDWSAIVREHAGAVFTSAWKILGDAFEAEDVSQDVFLEASRLWPTAPPGPWPGLLRRMATLRALDRLRRRKQGQSLKLELLESRFPSPQEVAAERELIQRLRAALAELPPREVEVFWLRHFEDFSHKEIADLLDITVGAVAAALHKARRKLQGLLDETSQERETNAKRRIVER